MNKISTLMNAAFLAGVLLLGPVRAAAQEAAAPAAGAKPEWKDRGEYDLFDSISKDTNAQTRIDKLNQWKEKYPKTDFATQRSQLFITTYAQANQPAKAIDAAKEVLAADPKDFTALYYTMLLTPQLPSAAPDQLDASSKAANSLLAGGIDTQFAKDKKPATVTDDQWTQARHGVEEAAHNSLAWVDIQQKHDDQADAEYDKAVASNPGDMNLVYGTLAKRMLGEKKYPEAIFFYTRAAAYDGPGALDAATRQKVMDYAKKIYTTYHGSAEGFEALAATAKTAPTKPADMKILSNVDIAKMNEAKDAELREKNPALAVWLSVKSQLTAADGENYFNTQMKGTTVPGISGKVISIDPAVRPKTVVLSVEDGTTPDATLQFDAPLPGKVDPGTVLTFDGAPVAYTANPYMVTFKVEKEALKGWPAAAAPPARRPVHK